MTARLALPLAGVLLLTACVASGPAVPPPPRPEAAPDRPAFDGVWTFLIENDNFAFSRDDGNYTNGIVLSWTSGEVERREPRSLSNRLVSLASFLPFMADARYRHHAGFSLGQLIFTPEDIKDPDPPPDARPYAGILFLDTTVYARGEHSLHAYTLRLGVTGEISEAEEVQKQLHDWFQTNKPRGWSTQIGNEPLLNLGYEYHRRLTPPGSTPSHFFDVTPHVGGTVGNAMIAASAGASFRLGPDLPDSYGPPSPRTGYQGHDVHAGAPGGRGWYYLFGGLEGWAVGRDLTLDGNTWKKSRSTDREDLVGSATIGFSVGVGRLLFTAGFSFYSDAYREQDVRQGVGALSLSWFR